MAYPTEIQIQFHKIFTYVSINSSVNTRVIRLTEITTLVNVYVDLVVFTRIAGTS